MGKKISLAGLRAEKKRLLTLIKKQSIARRKIRVAQEEEEKLKSEVRKLQRIAARKVSTKSVKLSRIIERVRSPETKEKLKKIKSRLQKGFKAFQKFANKHGKL